MKKQICTMLCCGALLFASCSSTDTSGVDTSHEIVDSIVNARIDSARNSFSARNDSIINAAARQKADSTIPAPKANVKAIADTIKNSQNSKVPTPWNK